MQKFVVEMENRRKNIEEEIEKQVTERRARIKEQEVHVSKELEKKYEMFRRHHEAVDKLRKNPEDDVYREQLQPADDIKILETSIMDLLNQVREYKPLIGPFVEVETDVNIKSVLNNMFSHMIQMKPTTNALIRWTPMSPGITQMYKASKIGHWCLHNVPMVVIPHPDFGLNNGEAILAQLRQGLITAVLILEKGCLAHFFFEYLVIKLQQARVLSCHSQRVRSEGGYSS